MQVCACRLKHIVSVTTHQNSKLATEKLENPHHSSIGGSVYNCKAEDVNNGSTNFKQNRN